MLKIYCRYSLLHDLIYFSWILYIFIRRTEMVQIQVLCCILLRKKPKINWVLPIDTIAASIVPSHICASVIFCETDKIPFIVWALWGVLITVELWTHCHHRAGQLVTTLAVKTLIFRRTGCRTIPISAFVTSIITDIITYEAN